MPGDNLDMSETSNPELLCRGRTLRVAACATECVGRQQILIPESIFPPSECLYVANTPSNDR